MKKQDTLGLLVIILAVLLAVFTLYTRPDFMIRMADLVWACF